MIPLSKKSKSKYRIPASMRFSAPSYSELHDKVSALEAALKKANADLADAERDRKIVDTYLDGAREREAAVGRVLNAVLNIVGKDNSLLVDVLRDGLRLRNDQINTTNRHRRLRIDTAGQDQSEGG